MGCTEIVQGGSAILVACFTGLLVLVAWRQTGIMKTQAAIQEAALAATRTAAEAAKKSADVAEKSVNNLERPYLLVESVAPMIKEHMGETPASSAPPSATLSLKNYGRSPALVSELRASLEMTQANQSVPFIRVSPPGNIIVIGPGESKEYTCRYSNLVGDGLRSQIENGTFHFWVFVSVSYSDMLDKEHKAQMKFRYEPRENSFMFVRGNDYSPIT
jgi:hypothetical protein